MKETVFSERSRSGWVGRWSLAPKMDVVSKLLFAAEKNRELLIAPSCVNGTRATG